MTKVWKVVQNILVNISQNQFLVTRAENGHGNQANIRMLRFGFVWQTEKSGVEFAIRVQRVRGHFGGEGTRRGSIDLGRWGWRRRGRGR